MKVKELMERKQKEDNSGVMVKEKADTLPVLPNIKKSEKKKSWTYLWIIQRNIL